MHDIKDAQRGEKIRFLSEDSLRYYENKEKSGESVHFLELSLDEVFSYEPIPKKIFTDEELEENRKAVRRTVKEVVRKKAKSPVKEEKSVRADEERLSELLAKNPYTEEQLEEISLAIKSGMEYSSILTFADLKNPADKMREMRESYQKTKDTTD